MPGTGFWVWFLGQVTGNQESGTGAKPMLGGRMNKEVRVLRRIGYYRDCRGSGQVPTAKPKAGHQTRAHPYIIALWSPVGA